MAFKVLLVEDDRTTAFMLKRLLDAEGFEVVLVEDGEAAFKLLDLQNHFDLLIVDYQLPRLNGRELITRLQSSPSAQVPTIMISGVIKLSEIADLLQKGIDRFLPKPIEQRALVNYAKLLVGCPPSIEELLQAHDNLRI
ncbi:MAG: response regulator transcription factor [Bdellovibrionales bacterium]|nr:response regulator transcription factor [Bdellovibrionales bacterium]